MRAPPQCAPESIFHARYHAPFHGPAPSAAAIRQGPEMEITMNHAVVWAGLRRFAGEEARKWRVLATATMGMAAAFGGIGTISVLMEPFQSEFGWARAEISAAYVVMTAGIATGGLMAGRLADRLPAGPLSAAGAAILGLGVALLSLQSSIEAMQAVYLLMGFFGFSLLQAPLLATVSLWFRKGLALGVVTAGGTLGQ